MAFTPIRMASPDGREVQVGSPTEREHLHTQGYRVITEPTPVRAPDTKPVQQRPALKK
ncbi:hypothetical protein ACFWU5_16200 [Nocardia sp. NPDC058640]|uniref:hypothetical protein n=1 Tax=Nocardia sp. NPDC058640 TaxID=3346571 RepID=UPI00366591C3